MLTIPSCVSVLRYAFVAVAAAAAFLELVLVSLPPWCLERISVKMKGYVCVCQQPAPLERRSGSLASRVFCRYVSEQSWLKYIEFTATTATQVCSSVFSVCGSD